MPPHHTRALNLLAPSATTRTATAPQLRLAQEVSVLGTLQGSLAEAERQGDTKALARLGPLVAARSDRVAVLVEQNDHAEIESMTDEERRAEIRRLTRECPWLREEGAAP